MVQKEKAAPSFAAAPEVFTSDLPSAKLDNFSETRKDLTHIAAKCYVSP